MQRALPYPLVLASGSPRRRELLAQAGYSFRVAVADIDESVLPGEAAAEYVARLAREKALAVLAGLRASGLPGAGVQAESPASASRWLVLGADTTVVAPQGEILGKPADDQDAARMLRLLSGATHTVMTGVALVRGLAHQDVAKQSVEQAVEQTRVTMRTWSEAEIAAYVASGEPRDKAGAYAIQGYAACAIPRIEGCYFNVVGLPLARVAQMIDRFIV